MTKPIDSFEDFERSLGSAEDVLMGSISIGNRILTGPVKFIEYKQVQVELILESKRGFGWVIFGNDSGSTLDVLVTRGVPVVVEWPSGYEPDPDSNDLVQNLREKVQEVGESPRG